MVGNTLYLLLNYCIQLNGYHLNVIVVAANTTSMMTVRAYLSFIINNIVPNIMYIIYNRSY